ncbi:manganese ABC transporter permease SitC [Spiribacter salinus M19-40]|jgi:manganese/zinc/iron transport system permease protein|uniref:Manganese ABC transporter permease SitC n=1 Tax=Spiribacter salinus M19-40 TaxID=1260251 RepID=R4VE51_9GAMM|nr:metal ABC transporter permease [Spiribacter salinus]AGM40591.1 manganese ABC transporter permease SitC [Spiribacter salinus M19-40]
MIPLLSDPTLHTVALGTALLGVMSGVLGSFAVLRRESLLGDTLSHAALPGVCLGFMVTGARSLTGLMAGALVTAMLAAFAMVFLVRYTRLKTDAALGIALGLFFALGVVLLTHIQATGGAAQAGLDAFLFGQAAALSRADLLPMSSVGLVAVGLVVLLWKPLKLLTFDPEYAAVIGLPVRSLELLITLLVALTVVVGLQLVGVVLMTAMVIAPAAAARQWCCSLHGMVILAALLGATAGVLGGGLSALIPGLSTGPVIVLVASVIALGSLFFAPRRGLIPAWWRQGHRLSRTSSDRVLETVYQLACEHGSGRYRVEEGAVDAYHGIATAAILVSLRERGLLEAVEHMPDEGRHWRLTNEGMSYAAARAGRPDEAIGV